MKSDALTIDRLDFSYGGQKIIEDYSLSLPVGERICVSAASGMGKTTLLRLIAGLERPDSGTIRTSGRIAYLFQEDRLLPWRTAIANVMLAGTGRNGALAALSEVGLGESAEKYPGELSGGMKRRTAIARLLVAGGDLLLLDEPFSGIDREGRILAAGAILHRFPNAAMVLVTHIPEEAELLGARIVDGGFIADRDVCK